MTDLIESRLGFLAKLAARRNVSFSQPCLRSIIVEDNELLAVAVVIVDRSQLDRVLDPSSAARVLLQSSQSQDTIQRQMGLGDGVEQRHRQSARDKTRRSGSECRTSS